ncbi:MAG: biopolymer transporter ExbD [Arcobacteraceae bacterium]
MKTNIGYEDNAISEINMTPFVDIVLVILVIFMATATFMVEGKISISLPKTSFQEENLKQEKPLLVVIDKEGAIYIDDLPISLEKLNEKLFAKRELLNYQGVIIRSDAKTAFENVVSVIDICKQNSILKFSIQTEMKR